MAFLTFASTQLLTNPSETCIDAVMSNRLKVTVLAATGVTPIILLGVNFSITSFFKVVGTVIE